MSATKHKPALMTPAELAAFIGKSEGTLNNWRYQGRGPKFLKVGGSARYRQEDVDAWLNAECGATA